MPNAFHQPLIITQGYGKTDFAAEPAWGKDKHFHRGIDAVPKDPKQWGVGAPIFALIPGTVWHVGSYEDNALHVIVKHDDGTWGCYWHLDSYQVTAGQRVTTDTQLGRMGTTGNSTKPHLHFEWLAAGPWKGMLSMTPIDSTALFTSNTTPATGPGKDDVTWNDFVRTMYRLFRPGDDLTDEIVNNHAGNLARLDSKGVDNWIRTFIASGDQYVTPRKVLATYWAAKGGADPDKYADDRLAGGATIASVLNGDLPADFKALKDAQEQKAATDAALTDATNHQRTLDAQILAQEDKIRELHAKLGQIETPPADVSLKGLKLLGDYLVRLTKKEQKGGGNS